MYVKHGIVGLSLRGHVGWSLKMCTNVIAVGSKFNSI